MTKHGFRKGRTIAKLKDFCEKRGFRKGGALANLMDVQEQNMHFTKWEDPCEIT